MPRTALLVVDMINPYDHPDASVLIRSVEAMIEPLARLIAETRDREDVALIYVNDNYGDFTATREDLVHAAIDGARPDLVKPILPIEDCSFVSKVRHSAFYSTPLGYLLRRLDAQNLVITGQVTEQCILYSALDAYVRHFTVRVPPEAVAHIDPDLGSAALTMMQRNMQAELSDTRFCW
jgi:nicotinamidase-related amidase